MDEQKETRQKYWKELDIEGKVERCRQQIKQLQSSFGSWSQSQGKLSNDFYSHEHGVNGKVVTPVNHNLPVTGLMQAGRPMTLDMMDKERDGEVYF